MWIVAQILFRRTWLGKCRVSLFFRARNDGLLRFFDRGRRRERRSTRFRMNMRRLLRLQHRALRFVEYTLELSNNDRIKIRLFQCEFSRFSVYYGSSIKNRTTSASLIDRELISRSNGRMSRTVLSINFVYIIHTLHTKYFRYFRI